MIFDLLGAIFEFLRIIIGFYFACKFFTGNISEQKTLWYGLAIIIFLLL